MKVSWYVSKQPVCTVMFLIPTAVGQHASRGIRNRAEDFPLQAHELKCLLTKQLENWNICLFVCLFVCLSHSRIFHSYGKVTIDGEGLQILTALYSWTFSSEGSLTCHYYRDKGHPFIMVIPEDPWNINILPSVWQWSCHYLFLRHRFVAVCIRTPNLPHAKLTL